MKNKLFSPCRVKRRVIYHFTNFSPLGQLSYQAHASHQEHWAGNCRQSSPCTNPQKLNWEHPPCRTKLTLPTLPVQLPKQIWPFCHMYRIVARLYKFRSTLSQLCVFQSCSSLSQCGTWMYSGYTLQWGLQGHRTSWSKTEEQSWHRWGSRVKNKILLSFLEVVSYKAMIKKTYYTHVNYIIKILETCKPAVKKHHSELDYMGTLHNPIYIFAHTEIQV